MPKKAGSSRRSMRIPIHPGCGIHTSSWFTPRTWLFGGKSRYEFLDTGLNASIQAAYHALAIDEYRVPFQPTLWEQRPELASTQVLEQVWFSGAHTNVGGEYDNSGLSDITLSWMIEKA
jgi:hypothetical protein